MYASPLIIGRASARPSPAVIEDYPEPSTPGLFDAGLLHGLNAAKERVAVYRMLHGEAAWQSAVASVDRGLRLHSAEVVPASRAYNKLIELVRTCAIRCPASSFHMCEAPGGFLHATVNEFPALRRATAMTLGGPTAPAFSRQIRDHPVAHLLALQHNGDVCHVAVRDEEVGRVQAVDFVTADGAFDNDSKPELTEAATARLILCEIDLASRVQAAGGCFVLKVFGITHQITFELLALLTLMYTEVAVVKPKTSRCVNDERYVVCTGFLGRVPFEVPASGGFLRSVCEISDAAWVADVARVSAAMLREQTRCLAAALRFRSTSRGDSAGWPAVAARSKRKMR